MVENYCAIKIANKVEWDSYLNRASSYDFYHTWYYHELDKEGSPFLFVYEFEENFIALPLIKRSIENTPFFDCTTVYGYAGPISNIPEKYFEPEYVIEFSKALLEFSKSENIISIFSRFHPIINSSSVWNSLAGIRIHGRTVCIDLTQDFEDQRKNYQRTIRAKVKQLIAKGFSVRVADSESDLDEFYEIYVANMVKVNASQYYYFNKEYFKNLLNSPDFNCELIVCCLGEEITSGTIITLSNNILQFHLAATKNEYLKEGPMKLLIDQVTLIGRKSDMKFMHLGGGVGGEEDNLFNFKAGFSNNLLDFRTWRLIADQQIYSELVHKMNLENTDSEYFPLYRFKKIS